MSFTHLHVATSFSSGHGTAWPAELAAAAARDGATALACTDRDGLYGAVKHLDACVTNGLVPILGVDLAVIEPDEDGARRRVSGRVVVLAHGGGYRALCLLVSDAHAHTRGRAGGGAPVGVTRQELAARAVDPETGLPVLTVLLGPESDVGLAMHGQRYLRPRTLFKEWLAAMPTGTVTAEVASHRSAPGFPFTTGHAVRMLKLAREHHLPAILSNAVRHLGPDGGVAPGTQAYLKSSAEMEQIAREIGYAADLRVKDLTQLIQDTERLAGICRLDPATDLGWERPQLPEQSVLGVVQDPQAELLQHCLAGLERRFPGRTEARIQQLRERLEEELAVIHVHGAASFVLHAAEAVRTITGLGIRVTGRGGATTSLISHLLGITAVDPLRHGLPFAWFPAASGPLSSQGLPGPLPRIELDIEPGRQREAHRALVRRFGKERSCLLGTPLDGARSAETSMEALLRVPDVADALPGALSKRPSGMALGDTSLLHRIPVQPGDGGLPLSQFAPQDLESWGVLRLAFRESPVQGVIAGAVREIQRLNPDAGSTASAVPSAGDSSEPKEPSATQVIAGGGGFDLEDIPLDDRPSREILRSSRVLNGLLGGGTAQDEDLGDTAPGNESGDPLPALFTARDAGEALSAYQAAWLRTHHPAAFLAGLWNTPAGPYPRHAILAEARELGIAVLPVDVNRSADECRVEPLGPGEEDRGFGLRPGLKESVGLSTSELKHLLANRPYGSMEDLLARAEVSRSTIRRLAEAGALDALHRQAEGPEGQSALVRSLQEFIARPQGATRTQVQGQLTLPLDGRPGPPEPDQSAPPAQDGGGPVPVTDVIRELTLLESGIAPERRGPDSEFADRLAAGVLLPEHPRAAAL